MRIPLNQISNASKCLRYHSFLLDSLLLIVPEEVRIATLAIKKCYLVSLETGFRADWRRIIGWVDTEVFKNVDVTNSEIYEQARKVSEHILLFISTWYHKWYLKENDLVYTDIPLQIELGKNTIISSAPIVKVREVPVLLVISNIDITPPQLYNQIDIRGLQWMLSRSLDVSTIQVDYLCIGKNGGMTSTTSFASTKDHDRTKDMINQIASSISAGFNYPSVTEMCNSCSFRGRCKI